MSLRLLIDECLHSKYLIATLRKAGRDVETAGEAGLLGQTDENVFLYATKRKRLVVTLNCIDFDTLAKSLSQKEHPGVLLIYSYNNPHRDMNIDQIVAALKNLEATNINLTNQVIVLNQYNY